MVTQAQVEAVEAAVEAARGKVDDKTWHELIMERDVLRHKSWCSDGDNCRHAIVWYGNRDNCETIPI